MTTRFEHLGRTSGLDDTAADSPDHEISLGTTTVLAIFVGLALLCGVFFGFGYSMGRKSMLPTLGNVDTHVSAPASEDNGSEDASGTPPDGSSSAPVVKGSSIAGSDAAVASTPPRVATASKPSAATAAPANASTKPDTRVLPADSADIPATAQRAATTPRTPPSPRSAATVPPPTTTAAAGTPSATPSFVQVAAISHREDADLLLASLHRRGYNASIRQLPQDNLLHIQVGPLASKKDAETMRQRLLSDGYNAIVK